MLQEIISSRRSQDATHIALRKKIVDVSNITKRSAVATCADATNFHDRVAHPHASVCDQFFGMCLNRVSCPQKFGEHVPEFLKNIGEQ